MVPNVNERGHSFKGVTAYLLYGELGAENPERVAWTSTYNMRTNDVEKAAKIMAWTDKEHENIRNDYREQQGLKATHAGATAGSGNVYHFSLSWMDGQDPDRQHMEDTARAALESLSLQNHEYYFVAHGDTDHKHLHVVVNLVNPETGYIASVQGDFKTLDRFSNEYEQKHGIVCENRAKKYNAWDSEKDYQNGFEQTPQSKAERSAEYKQHLTAAYSQADSGGAFVHALEDKGLELAWSQRGKRGGFVVVDNQGDIYGLTRLIDGAKKRDVSALLKDVDTQALRGAEDLAKDRAAAYKEQETSEERTLTDEQNDTAARVDELEELAQDPMSDLQGWLDQDLHGKQQQAAQYFDRDQYEAERQEQIESAAITAAQQQQAIEQRGAAITKNLQISIKREAKAQYAELRQQHREEWKSAKGASGQFDRATILETFEPVIAEHEAEKARLEGISSSWFLSTFYRLREGESVQEAIEAQRRTIEDAQARRDSYLKIMDGLKARHERERQDLKEDIDERLGDAAGEGIAQARAEQQEGLLNEAQASPEAAQRVSDTVQAKTTQGRGKVAKIKTLAREQDNKILAKTQEKKRQEESREKDREQTEKRGVVNRRIGAEIKGQSENQETDINQMPIRDLSVKPVYDSKAADVTAKDEKQPDYDALSYGTDGQSYTPEEIERMKREQYLQSLRGEFHNIENEPDQGHEPER